MKREKDNRIGLWNRKDCERKFQQLRREGVLREGRIEKEGYQSNGRTGCGQRKTAEGKKKYICEREEAT